MMLLDSTYATELGSNLLEAFLVSLTSHAVVHVGPLIVLTGSSVLQVGNGVRNLASVQILEPQLSVLALVACCLQEESCNLLVAVLLGL